jgi:hypothetical protein
MLHEPSPTGTCSNSTHVYASFLGVVNPLPSAFVRLRSISCPWQYSWREILRAESLGPASIVKVEAAGDGGTTLTGADGPYHEGEFRAKASPDLRSGPSFAF